MDKGAGCLCARAARVGRHTDLPGRQFFFQCDPEHLAAIQGILCHPLRHKAEPEPTAHQRHDPIGAVQFDVNGYQQPAGGKKVVDKFPQLHPLAEADQGGAGQFLQAQGAQDVIVCDERGALVEGDRTLPPAKAELTRLTNRRMLHGTLADAIGGVIETTGAGATFWPVC